MRSCAESKRRARAGAERRNGWGGRRCESACSAGRARKRMWIVVRRQWYATLGSAERKNVDERWCPRSTPHLRIDFLGILFDKAIDLKGFLTQTLQLAHVLYPRLVASQGVACQPILDCFGDKLTERNPSLRSDRLGAAANGVVSLQ